MKRLIRKEPYNIFDPKQCRYCGSFYGTVEPGPRGCRQCRPSTCLLCGSRVCMTYGLARGTCPVCYIGLLPGWSGNDCRCQRKGCTNKAAGVYRKRRLCRDHIPADKWTADLEQWREVDDAA